MCTFYRHYLNFSVTFCVGYLLYVDFTKILCSFLLQRLYEDFVLLDLQTFLLTFVTGQILFTTHTAGFLSLQLYSGGEQPTPQEEVFTASVSRVEKLCPSLQDRSIYAKQLS